MKALERLFDRMDFIERHSSLRLTVTLYEDTSGTLNNTYDDEVKELVNFDNPFEALKKLNKEAMEIFRRQVYLFAPDGLHPQPAWHATATAILDCLKAEGE